MRGWFFLTLFLSACLDLALPQKQVLGPGTLRATVVATRPGRSALSPAAGARMRLVGSSLEAVADADGNVALAGLTESTGQVLVEFDGDGTPGSKRARLLSLEVVHAGFGKDVNLGQLVLGTTSTVVGIVRRADVSTATGHGGITVFAPQLRPLTFTGDDGAFVLDGLPEGELTIAASAQGYESANVRLSVGSGTEHRLSPLALRRAPPGTTTATLTGQVRSIEGALLEQVTVRALRGSSEVSTTTGADGVFTFSAQPIGFTLLALEKTGFVPVAVGNVVVEAPVTTVGPFFMSTGSGSVGPLVPPDAGVGGGAGGGSAGGGSAAGGSAAGGSAAGGSAAGGSAAGGSAAGGSAAGGSAAGGSAAGGSAAGGSTAGGAAAGGAAAGGSAAGGSAAGGSATDAGVDGGVLPVAVVGAAQVVTPGAMVTLDGTASSGAQPLTYTWTALAPNASVMVTPNGTLAAHTARFTAGTIGNVIEFSLVVTDRFGVSSTNPAIARVVVSRIPTARFGPDGGSFTGSDSIELVSTSFDDGGLLLTGHSWAQVPAVAGASLVADGGRAVLTFPPLMMGDAPALVGVELTVTNVLGVTSAPARQTYVARPGAGTNWTLTAAVEGPNPILYTGSNPPSRIVPTITTNLSAPSYSLSWQCTNMSTTSQVTDGGVFEFVVPRVVGPDVIASCQVTATGAAPLNPSVLTATTAFVLRDDENPSVVLSRPTFSTARASPWGLLLRTTEPVNATATTCSAVPVERTGNTLIAFAQTLMNPILNPQVCPAWTAQLLDFGSPPNFVANVPLSPSYSTAPQWEGPFVSAASYDDPRPVIVSAGVLPFDTLAASSPPMNPPTPYALVARDGTNLLTLSLDVLSPPRPCSPDCVLPVSPTPVAGLPAVNGAPQGVRATNSGTHLLVAMHEADGGFVYARRSPAGVWSAFALEGALFNAGSQLRRLVIVDGGVVSDVLDPATLSLSSAELVTMLPPDGGTASPGETRFYSRTALVSVHRNGAFAVFQRDPVTATWDAGGPSPLQDTSGLIAYRPGEDTNVGSWATVSARSVAPHMQIYERTGGLRPLNSLGPPTGFDLIQRGAVHVVAVAQNGDLRLYGDSLTNTVMAPIDGPPRAVPLAPGDNRFDLDVACEAAWPRLAFIEDALVVTWQERCAPSTAWRIVARVVH